MLEPTPVTPPTTASDDPRLGHLLGDDAEQAAVVLLGFPSDEGVRRNGGRPGAAEAPDAIRRRLYALTPDARHYDAFVHVLRHTVDLGNLRVTGDVEADQQRLGEALAPYLARGVLPILLGGGHETSYGHFLGHVAAGQSVGILNWDAHPDVRPLLDGQAHSGSPFRQALEHPSGRCAGYTVAGLQPHSVAQAHLRFLDAHDSGYVWREDVTPERVQALYAEADAPTLVTFDMDAVDQAFAPGVSAPAPYGLPVERWLQAAYAAGRSPHVASVDLVEVNPRLDVDDRTARLAALTVWHLLERNLRPTDTMKVQVFTTGGTIDKVYFDAQSEYEVGEPQIVDILNEANATLDYEVTTLMRKDSLDLTDEDRAHIRAAVQASPCRHILITHGTDTMVQTAQALRDISDKTIVLVGSLTPARFKYSDAEFNIGFALGAVQALPPGVYVAMNGQIFDPENVQKNREANRFETA